MNTLRKLLLMSGLLIYLTNAQADDILTVDNVTLPQNGEVALEIKGTFETNFTQFQLEIELTEGITLKLNSNGRPWAELGGTGTDHTITSSNPSTNTFKFVCSSMSQTTLPTSEVVMRVMIEPSEELEVGTVLNGTIKSVLFNEYTGSGNIGHNFADLPFSVTIGEPDDGRIKFDENATTLPTYTAGNKGNVTMKRTIKAGEWSTIVLPFTLTKAKAETAFGSGVELMEFSGFEVDYGDDEENVVPLSITINLATYTLGTKKSMTGGKPFLIRTNQDIEEFEADDVTLSSSVTDVEKTDAYDTSGKLTGTLVKTVIPEDGLFLSGNKFWYSTGSTNVKAFRCWFELGAVLDKDTDFGARVFLNIDDEETTGIISHNSKATINSSWYTLDGRKMDKKPSEKGIYIVDNKKVVVR
jgi:hypothetical protein